MPQGLVILALTAGGKGATLGLQVGDVLYAMNGKALGSLEMLRGYLDHLLLAVSQLPTQQTHGYSTKPIELVKQIN
jgi:S1-C subfamily serine protease